MSGHTEDKPKDCRYCYFWKQTEGCTYRGACYAGVGEYVSPILWEGKLLGAVTGRWALYCVDRPLRSLDFLNTVLD